VIGPGAVVRGDVASTGPVEIRGTLEGDCRTSAHCVVREGARVLGNIEATALVVAGEIEAGLLRADKVEVRASAKVIATIRARVVAIADGALYEGDVEMEGPTPSRGPVHFRERRQGEGEGPSGT